MSALLEAVSTGEAALLDGLADRRARLAAHPLYGSIHTLDALRLFMESHIYAVWDFMSLLKALQRALTCVELPWHPTKDAATRRLINDIVLGEESDVYEGEVLSHYELYLRAMRACGARTALAEKALGQLQAVGGGKTVEDAFSAAPTEATRFVRRTFAILETGATHRIAAAFAFGREDLIPTMFQAFVRELDEQLPDSIAPFRYYLERHIELDGDEHGPMALRMMRNLCQTEQQWAEAAETAAEALDARLALWDGIHARVLALSAG